MIAYIKGSLEEKNTDFVVIDVNGMGYKVYMPKTSINELENLGNIIKVHTFLKVREDDVSIYGFKTKEELNMFELLISVGGIGAKIAVSILSEIKPSKFALAVITNDVNLLKKLPGIGPKTAQRIILELKDKIKTEEAMEENADEKVFNEEDYEELIQALQVLGFKRFEINTILPKITSESLEDKIKEALQYLSR